MPRQSEPHFKSTDGRKLLASIRSYFENKKLFLKDTSNLVFVCGGNDRRHGRTKFLNQVSEHPVHKKITPILAEDAYKALNNENDYTSYNSSDFECLLADISYCVVIFLEGYGSLAELGLFSAIEKIRKKTFVIQDQTLQQDSFINTGPIDKINTFPTMFRTAFTANNVWLKDEHSPGTEVSDVIAVLDRIQNVLPSHSQRYPYEFAPFSRLNPRLQFFIALEIINLFSIVRIKDFKFLFEEIFGGRLDTKAQEALKMTLSMLIGAKYVYSDLSLDRTERYICSKRPDPFSFFEAESGKPLAETESYTDLQREIYTYNSNNHPEKIEYLNRESAA